MYRIGKILGLISRLFYWKVMQPFTKGVHSWYFRDLRQENIRDMVKEGFLN